MSRTRIFPALRLTLIALVALSRAQADEKTVSRPAQWAQPIAAQYNLH